jgi:hypothetical protein
MTGDAMSGHTRVFRARRSLLAVLLVGAVIALAAAFGADRGTIGVLMIAFVIVAFLSTLTALTWRVSVVDQRLYAAGRPRVSTLPVGGVDLSALSRVRSVSMQYGAVSQFGLPFMRPFIIIQDTHGGAVLMWVWGWEDKNALMALLRRAVLASHAKMDPLSFWRLGFKPSGPGQVNRWRRFL